MRRRGTITIFFLFILLFSSLSTAAIPPHKNFSDADEDLLSILAFLADTKTLCEQTLIFSYEANATLTIDEPLQLFFDTQKQNQSLILSDQLSQRTKYSKTILHDLNHTITSYQHLEHVLVPLKTLGMEIEDISKYHSHLLDLFQQLISFLNQSDAEYDQLLSLITPAYQDISKIRQGVDFVETPLLQLSSYYDISILQNQTIVFNRLMDRYEFYLDQLLSSVSLKEPKLVLYTDQSDYYVGETINFSGYFITSSGFVPHQSIAVSFDQQFISDLQTNDQGRYDGTYQTNINRPATTVELAATTIYDQTTYESDVVTITLHLRPTNLSIYLIKTHFQPNETRFVTGRLTTLENKGIRDTINLSVDDHIIQLQTNQTGYYSYDLTSFNIYGSYHLQAAYQPNSQYEHCLSKQLQFFIDEPTMLSIHRNSSSFSPGETIVLTGYLKEKTQLQALSNQSISLSINGKKRYTTTTNEQGYYQFSFSTANHSASPLFFQTWYTPTDPQWRASSSSVLSIRLTTGLLGGLSSYFSFFSFSSSPFHFLIIIIICVLFLILFFTVLFHMKKQWFKSKKDIEFSASPPFFPYQANMMKQQIDPTQPSSSELMNPTLSMKQKIITTYRTMLRFLSQQGIPLKKTDTHRDIQQSLYTTLLPKKTVDAVTVRFEQARYAPYEINEQDVNTFDEQVFSLITEYTE